MEDNLFKDIKNKVCVVTGASGVLGKVFVEGLLDIGARVVVMDYKKERGDQYTAELAKKSGAQVMSATANVLNKEELKHAKEEINSNFGKIDVLLNGAGGNSPLATAKSEYVSEDNINDLTKTFFGLELDGFRHVFDLNFLGTVLPTMVFAEDMLNRGGAIVNVSSMNSYRPLTKIPAYSAAKASINNFTLWLAVHFSKVNIRVNAIAPGFFLTKQNEFLLVDANTKELTARGKKIIDGTPMGRFGQPEELLGTLYYLISDTSKFVTGVVIPVDGGFSAYSGV